jgi:murein DD-endopeptidase MepM/ murein hydrolase activator NlpD
MKQLLASLSSFFKRWFHKRNIIIISERKVKHVPISGPLQFITLSLLVVGVCWASYSTGSYMAAKSALKQQGQALRSVTNAHIESSFSTGLKSASNDVSRHSAADITSPSSALSSLDNAELVARITLLENKVVELKNTNVAIVQRVHEKANGRLSDLENVIKQTGLNLSVLKKQYSENKPEKSKRSRMPAEGGPYVPGDLSSISNQEKEMLSDLDDLALITHIVSELPLAMPIKDAQEESPFGRRVDPINGHLAFHSGLDLSGPAGSKIYSTADGKVTFADRNGAYGNAIDINHGFGISTRYGHLSEILVKEGQSIQKGQVIGIQGSTGRSTGAHLHYEVRYNDQALNPKNFLLAGRHVSQQE